MFGSQTDEETFDFVTVVPQGRARTTEWPGQGGFGGGPGVDCAHLSGQTGLGVASLSSSVPPPVMRDVTRSRKQRLETWPRGSWLNGPQARRSHVLMLFELTRTTTGHRR